MCSDRPGRQRGISLVELIVFMVIVGIAVAGILQVFNIASRRSAEPLRRKQALMLAEGFLEEVQLAKFSYCDANDSANAGTAASTAGCTAGLGEGWGPEAGNTRPFDNVNDYVPAANTSVGAFDVGGVLSDANGEAVPVAGYTVKLTISPAALGPAATPVGNAAATSADTPVLRIRVEVGYGGPQPVVLDAYRTRYAPNSL